MPGLRPALRASFAAELHTRHIPVPRVEARHPAFAPSGYPCSVQCSAASKGYLMEKQTDHIARLRLSETQFRLASAVRLASTFENQPLDLPIIWTHGRRKVSYAEIALTQKEADIAAFYLQRSATFLMASTILYAIKARYANPKKIKNLEVVAAYQIARMIRNAFAHSPLEPFWNIDPDCQNCIFEIDGVVKFDTKALDGKPFNWRDYGGPLSILELSRFVRLELLGDSEGKKKVIPLPKNAYYQQGDVILKRLPRTARDFSKP